MTAVGLGGLLLAIWLLLWGSVTPANVLSGVVVIALVLRFIPDARFRFRRPTVRVGPALRFAGLVLVDLFRANLVVTREILSRESSINTGVVAVPLPLCSDGLLTLVANVLSLTPGTMPIEVTREPPVIYVHVLHLRDVEAVRRDVQRLSALAIRAFGSPEAVAILDHPDWTRPTEVTDRLVDAGPSAGRPEGEDQP
ncbi:Na+/H+ antiporter subunit E [Aquihabitans sp. G128]|uniref:Na+/H+ antiporter subunit E n=1 Tax=Aquihabitans sp. G128 TaxID=2849779 RepID=UPI001C223C6A|nr:Na+/H+ antiporter subunit E [Aquihabitans sp. G128]QXC59172.1 Na+/H+ antiporter subunit E [Aquihabitans sp. G128]